MKFLDKEGVTELWKKVKEKITSLQNTISNTYLNKNTLTTNSVILTNSKNISFDTTKEWYVTIDYRPGYSDKDFLIKIRSNYDNHAGTCYFHKSTSFQDQWYMDVSNYGGCNILGIATSDNASDIMWKKIYLKLRAPKTSGYVQILYSFNNEISLTASETAPEGITFIAVKLYLHINLHSWALEKDGVRYALVTDNVASATKLQNSRTISLTGNANGSASFDGTSNISINTTVNKAASADSVEWKNVKNAPTSLNGAGISSVTVNVDNTTGTPSATTSYTPTTGSNTPLTINLKGLKGESGIREALNITYSDLKTLRDNNQLVPGRSYRITDYVCTTKNSNAYGAYGHPFDIIVIADSTNKLNERARAIQHDGYTYFSNSKLEAWKLWYCLDNDTSRFAWANTSIGKGVVYRMIDEFNNDCPYDFKSITFLRYSSDQGIYTIPAFTESGSDELSYYTFSVYWNGPGYSTSPDTAESNMRGSRDASIKGSVYNNTIKPYIKNGVQLLNNITFTDDSYNNVIDSNCYLLVFDSSCHDNTLGQSCNNIEIASACSNNTFGINCSYIQLGSNSGNNTFGNTCNHNTIGRNFTNNTIGNVCSNIKIPNYFRYSKIDDGTSYITISNTDSRSDSLIQFFHFTKGLIYDSPQSITLGTSLFYETTIARTKTNQIVQYCEADKFTT